MVDWHRLVAVWWRSRAMHVREAQAQCWQKYAMWMHCLADPLPPLSAPTSFVQPSFPILLVSVSFTASHSQRKMRFSKWFLTLEREHFRICRRTKCIPCKMLVCCVCTYTESDQRHRRRGTGVQAGLFLLHVLCMLSVVHVHSAHSATRIASRLRWGVCIYITSLENKMHLD